MISPLLRRLKWFVTLIKHIIQLIVRSFANIDKEEKKSEADKRMPDIPEADEELPELKGAGLLITEKENVQRIVKAEPRIASSYVPNHERKEADKTYAERKLQEIENLQVSQSLLSCCAFIRRLKRYS